jgi:TolB-like protein
VGESTQIRLCLWGTFRLFAGDGTRIEISSRKGMALLAMLATAPDGARTRGWLQDRLWGSREKPQAQQSLRRELATLRSQLPPVIAALIRTNRETVRLDCSPILIETPERDEGPQFLEGFDIPGENGFEEWLREQRHFAAVRPAPPLPADLAPVLPRSIVDLRDPTPGFGGRPAIAVLPLVNATALSDADFWAEGLTEDLIERISRLRWLPVIASNSVAELRGRDLDPRVVGELVGAAYVLSGRLVTRRATMAIMVNLYDASTSQLLWSERISPEHEFGHDALDEVIDGLVAALEARIDTEQQVRAVSRAIDGLNVNELLWRARWHFQKLTRQDAEIAQQLIVRALELNPNSPDVLIHVAEAKAWDVWSGRGGPDEIEEMRATALRATLADRFDGRAYMLVGVAEMWLRHHDLAHEFLTEALRLNPSLAKAYSQLGSNYSLAGNPAAALAPLRTALRLSPLDNEVFHMLGELALAYLMRGELEEALRHADLSIARRPAYFYAHVLKISALVQSERMSAARRAVIELRRAKPNFDANDIDWVPFRDPSWNERLKQAIVAAETG